MRKKIVFICARLPYPASNGRKSVMYHYSKILNEIYDYDVYTICFLEYGDCADNKPIFIKDVHILKSISFIRKLYNIIKYTFIKKSLPMQVSLYYSPKHKSEINELIKKIDPDVVMADMVRTCEYIRDFSGFKIADLDDLISLRYDRQLRVDLTHINIYGNYIHSLPVLIQKILNIKKIKTLILKNEITLLKEYEHKIASICDKTVFVAKNEADILNQEMHFDKACAIPLGVDIDYYGEFYRSISYKKHTIAFLGVMNVAHNEAGVIYFINEVLPLIRKKIADVKFVVVGGGVTECVMDLADDSVVLTGRVEDVRTVVGSCEVFVCPLTFGSGIKTKNLEAMAMGIPVVTTSIGAENINAKDGEEWFIADSALEIANKVINIMEDTELRDRLVSNAYEFVRANFTWKVAEEKMKLCLPNGNTDKTRG